jgi:hypothetical protein
MLIQPRIAANVNAGFEHGVNSPVIFAAGFVEIPVLETGIGVLEIAV